jgi:undecaprenyl-phosphate 4-deoxy-4-formamido-L-arabinose transferase
MIDAAEEISVEGRQPAKPIAATPKLPELSIVCTVFNEESAIPELLDQLVSVLSTLDLSSEIVMVDDGSRDHSLARLKGMIGQAPGIRVVELYRNYGQVAALGAGMSVARGDWIVMLDGDLQHDPQDIRRLVAEIANGHDLVATYRDRREDTSFRLAVTWLGNHVNRYLTGERIQDFGSAYRLFNARLLDMMTDGFGYVHYNTPALYINARSCIELPITQFRRRYGTSKWNLISLIQYNLDFLIHSKKVTQVLLNIGLLGMFIGVALYVSSLFGFAEPARAISAPISIAFTSFLVMLLAVIWREVMQTQRYARGQPPFSIAGIWRDRGDGIPELEAGPRFQSVRLTSNDRVGRDRQFA